MPWAAAALIAIAVLGEDNAPSGRCTRLFVELWSHPGRYDPGAGTLRTYLTMMARHRAVDVVRSELRRVARQERSCRLTPVAPARGAGEQAMAAHTAGVVRAAVQLLPASQRQVIELAYFEGLTC